MKSDLRPAFYSLAKGTWRDYVTLLHFPYTGWHLSYVVLGAVAAPSLHLEHLGLAVLAFFLAVGLGAHALDEFQGRPLRTDIPDVVLLAIAALSMAGALAIGGFVTATISLWAVPFVLFGGFIVPAYNLEWFRGRFHSDMWFGFAWGAFPALVGYWVSALRLDPQALLVAAACLALSMAQRVLSKQVRGLRRRAKRASGQIEFRDGRIEPIDIPYLLTTPEMALTRIHRRTSLGTALEEASGCSSESGIMVLEQKPARKQGAPNRCCHRTNPTVSASSLTTIAWWPMPACSCRPP